MTHASPAAAAPDTGRTPEPVAIAAAVQAVLVAAAALGWLVLDDVAISAVGTAVATVGTVAAVLVARGRVRAIRPDEPAPTVEVDAEALRTIVRAELDARGIPGAPARLVERTSPLPGRTSTPRPRPYVPPP